jgi:hypothetical protein
MTFNGTTLTLANDASISGLTVGKGLGAVSTNTVVGANSLAANTSGSRNTAYGWYVLTSNTTGVSNSGLGNGSLNSTSSGSYNTAIGDSALLSNTTASNNTAVGYQAGYTNQIGSFNVFVGQGAGYFSNFNGNALNTFVGPQSGYVVTSGTKNTILGGYNGNLSGLDIRIESNYVVLSDGDGNVQQSSYYGGTTALQGAVPNAGTGITFPATQSASSNANTLDDYEEGTWTVGLTAETSGTITTSTQTGTYVKIGRQVTVSGFITVASVSSPVGLLRMTGLPIPNGSQRVAVSIWPHSLTASAITGVVGFIQASESTVILYVYTAGNGAVDMASYVQAGTNLVVSATYFI